MNDWTSAEWLLIIPVIGLQLIGLVRAWRRDEVVGEIRDDAKKTLISSQVILGHVNSEKQIGMGERDVLRSENALLREQLTEARQIAAVLATQQQARPARASDPALPTSGVLARIETNTAETAKGVQSLTDRP